MGTCSGTFFQSFCLKLDCVVDSGHRNLGPKVKKKSINCLPRDIMEVLEILGPVDPGAASFAPRESELQVTRKQG